MHCGGMVSRKSGSFVESQKVIPLCPGNRCPGAASQNTHTDTGGDSCCSLPRKTVNICLFSEMVRKNEKAWRQGDVLPAPFLVAENCLVESSRHGHLQLARRAVRVWRIIQLNRCFLLRVSCSVKTKCDSPSCELGWHGQSKATQRESGGKSGMWARFAKEGPGLSHRKPGPDLELLIIELGFPTSASPNVLGDSPVWPGFEEAQ